MAARGAVCCGGFSKTGFACCRPGVLVVLSAWSGMAIAEAVVQTVLLL